MRIVIKNEYGSLEIGGGNHPSARLLDAAGLGLPNKEIEVIAFAGQAGQTINSIKDSTRTITISFDFYGGQSQIEKIYKLLYKEVGIYITVGDKKRKITGICVNPEEVQKIIYGAWYKLVLQFVCAEPYFSDFYNTKISLSQRTDLFPNVCENGEWFIELPAVATERISKAHIYNRGDVKLYPKIIINNNSLSDIESETYGVLIQNETTGAKIILNYDSQPNEIVTIDLPHRKIISNINGNITNMISDDTVLADFYLIEGGNILSTINLNSYEDISVLIEYNNNYAMAVI